MSGIFKSVKKVFRKIGKFVKKYWKPIVIAAAVYFGGAYLMSAAGGAGAAAQTAVGAGPAYAGASVGTRIAGAATHSGHIWRNAISSMLSGGSATASAASYANAIVGAKDLALSSQVVAGTSAVKTLNFMKSTMGIGNFTSQHIADASKLGVEAGKAFAVNGQQGLNAATKAAQDYLSTEYVAASKTLGPEILDPAFQVGERSMASVDPASFTTTAEAEIAATGADATQAVAESVATTGQPEVALTSAPTVDIAAGSGIETLESNITTGTDVPQLSADTSLSSGSSAIQSSLWTPELQKAYLDQLKGNTALQTQQMAALKQQAGINKLALGMQGVGLLLSALGERDKAKASERIRTKQIPDEWKKSGVPGINWKGIKV